MEYATTVIIGIAVILIGVLIIAHILHNNVNEQKLKEFEEKLSKAKYATCEYVYTNPFIPILKDIYIVKEIKNGWVRLIQIKSVENPEPFFKTEEKSYIDLPIKEAYQVLNLQIIE
jgi:hypothetical protein